MNKKLLIDIQNITIRLGGKNLLPDTDLKIFTGDNFIVTGENGSGKTSLMKVLSSDICVCKGSVLRFHSLPLSKSISYLSFEKLKKILKKEALTEESEYYSGKNLKQSAYDCLFDKNAELRSFDLEKFKSKTINDLSSGELRKFQILQTLEKKPEILILDEPFDGLDKNSVKDFKKILNDIARSDIVLIIVTHRVTEIPDMHFKHIHIENNRVSVAKKFEGISFSHDLPDLSAFKSNDLNYKKQEIVNIENAFVGYDEKVIFSNLNLKINSGEKWVVKGENGSGKSTLISLITGDHLQCYSNKIEIFGKKRGRGESIWEIKKNTGLISPGLHLKYNKTIEAYKVVVSGFFDSIGLYRKPDKRHLKTVRFVFEKFNIMHLYDEKFSSLSYGQQRLILILRALIKDPKLIIMDEPCHGLDKFHRELVLEIVRKLSSMENKALIYVSHDDTELDFNYDFVFEFIKSDKGYTGKIKKPGL